MSSFEARKLIEALRSGVPSRAVGRYFSGTRTRIVALISAGMHEAETGKSNGKIITGKYGELSRSVMNRRWTSSMFCMGS